MTEEIKNKIINVLKPYNVERISLFGSFSKNKLIHEYFGVDLNIVWNTAKIHLPELKSFPDQYSEEYRQR